MIGGQMYLYSIPQLHKVVQSSDLYKSKIKRTDKDILIDKFNWVIHSIVQSNRHKANTLFQSQPVPLHREILKSMLGKAEYIKITRELVELGYITIDHNYTSTAFLKLYNNNRIAEGKKALPHLKPSSKKYALSDKALNEGIVKVGVLTSRMRIKIRKYKTEKIKKYSNDKIHSKILNSITKVEFNPNHTKAIETINKYVGVTDKDKYYNEVYHELQELKQINSVNQLAESDFFYYTQSENVGRVFHYLSTIPKPFRESLQLKSGGKLSEIDLKNSQPLIIALNYLKDTNQTNTKLLNDVLSGNFYNAVAQQALKNNDVDTFNQFSENYSKFKANVLGKGLYFNYIPNPNDVKPMERYLMELYPNFMKYIRNKKRVKGYKIISIEAQLIESSIFIDGLYSQLNKTDVAIPVHDSIIVPTENEGYFLDKLIYIFKQTFPYISNGHIKELFRITQY
ncbi:hypothetical protein [Gillisia sp. JM1]|uniref:hypothetical protein n=1 Tax=Gillisia sp. JM1 TaxID=1283286 RepID=UPI0003FE54B3|nr:hypothetical protein [Gillisia sp. JM1]